MATIAIATGTVMCNLMGFFVNSHPKVAVPVAMAMVAILDLKLKKKKKKMVSPSLPPLKYLEQS